MKHADGCDKDEMEDGEDEKKKGTMRLMSMLTFVFGISGCRQATLPREAPPR